MTSARDFCRAANPNFERADPSTTWSDPKYPGDSVRIARLEWDGGKELGDVRIQHFGVGSYRVACFCPGRVVDNPGDSPKVEPECYHWCETVAGADQYFDLYVSREIRDGWKLLTTTPETAGQPLRRCYGSPE